MNNIQQYNKTNYSLAETKEAKTLLPILEEFVGLYGDNITNAELKKRNLLFFANELSKVQINNRPAIEVATPTSIRETTIKVLTEDIDFSKKQAIIVPYGDVITLQKEFYGNVALAKKLYDNNIEFRSQVVYPKDEFEIIKNGITYGVDLYQHSTKPANMVKVNDNGYKSSETPSFVYTYVVDLKENKPIASGCFSYQRCYDSWTQGGQLKQTHKKFASDMMIKTLETYIATRLYNKSNSETPIIEDFEYSAPTADFIQTENFEVSKEEPKVKDKPKVVKNKKPVAKEPEPIIEVEPIQETEVKPIVETETINEIENFKPSVEADPINEIENFEPIVEQEHQVQEEYAYNDNDWDDFLKKDVVQETNHQQDAYDYQQDMIKQYQESKKEEDVITVLYSDWKNNYSKTGEWQLVPATYDAVSKTTQIKRK